MITLLLLMVLSANAIALLRFVFNDFGFAGTSDILRSTHVENKEYCLFLFFLECLYKSPVAFRGHIPVNGPDIISILVRPDVIELKAGAFENGMEVALHMAVDSLTYLYFVVPQFL